MLAHGHYIAQAWREAESADHRQDPEARLVRHRVSASPGIDARGVGLALVTVLNTILPLCEARYRPKSTIPESLNSSTFCPPVKYFQTLGCVLGPASAVVTFCTGRDAVIYGWSELEASQLGNRT